MMTPRPHRGLPSGRRRASRRGHWVWLVPSLVVVAATAVAIPLTLTGDVHQRGGQPGHSTGSPTAPGAASWQVPRDEGGLDGKNSWVLNSYVAAHSAGRVAWISQILPPGTATALTLDAVLVEAAGPAVVIGFNDQIGAFSLTGGKFLGWHFSLSRKDQQYREHDTCNVTDLLNAGDAQHVYFTDRCVLSGVVQYGTIDTAAATMRGSSVMPGAVPFKLDRADLVSANPLVILLRADGPSRGEYLLFDTGRRLMAKRPTGRLSVADINFGLPPGDFHRRWRAITDGHTLVTVTDARANRANKLVAVDTTTGKTRWSVSLGSAHVYTPFAIDGRQVLVAAATHAGSGALEAVRVDLATGKAVSATASTRAPFTGNPDLGAVTQFGWENGQVFGIPTTHAGPVHDDLKSI